MEVRKITAGVAVASAHALAACGTASTTPSSSSPAKPAVTQTVSAQPTVTTDQVIQVIGPEGVEAFGQALNATAAAGLLPRRRTAGVRQRVRPSDVRPEGDSCPHGSADVRRSGSCVQTLTTIPGVRSQIGSGIFPDLGIATEGGTNGSMATSTVRSDGNLLHRAGHGDVRWRSSGHHDGLASRE